MFTLKKVNGYNKCLIIINLYSDMAFWFWSTLNNMSQYLITGIIDNHKFIIEFASMVVCKALYMKAMIEYIGDAFYQTHNLL